MKIDKNIPIPLAPNSRKYPFNEMKVGDSFFVEVASLKRAQMVQANLIGCTRRRKGKFTTRLCRNPLGIRIWRIEV